jgi:hypothetical protein
MSPNIFSARISENPMIDELLPQKSGRCLVAPSSVSYLAASGPDVLSRGHLDTAPSDLLSMTAAT